MIGLHNGVASSTKKECWDLAMVYLACSRIHCSARDWLWGGWGMAKLGYAGVWLDPGWAWLGFGWTCLGFGCDLAGTWLLLGKDLERTWQRLGNGLGDGWRRTWQFLGNDLARTWLGVG